MRRALIFLSVGTAASVPMHDEGAHLVRSDGASTLQPDGTLKCMKTWGDFTIRAQRKECCAQRELISPETELGACLLPEEQSQCLAAIVGLDPKYPLPSSAPVLQGPYGPFRCEAFEIAFSLVVRDGAQGGAQLHS